MLLPLVACPGGDGLAPASSGEPSSPAWFAPLPLDLPELHCGRAEVPTILESLGGGVALFDADDDGDLDAFFAEPGEYPAADSAPGRCYLYRNDGGVLADATGAAGIDLRGWCGGVSVADVDGDGSRDLYVCRLGPNALLLNRGSLRFEEAPSAGGAAGDDFSTSAAFADFDLDGDLDLYVVNYVHFDPAHPPLPGEKGRACIWNEMRVYCGPQGLEPAADRYYRNDGGRLVEATAEAGFAAPASFGLGVIDGDFDQNGWPDLYVANDSMPNFLFQNDGDGTVTERGILSGAGLSASGREQAGMGIAAGDVESDGDEDLLVTNFSMDDNAFYVNEGDAHFRDESARSGLGPPSRPLLGWGAAFLDVDLDADLDLAVAYGHVYPQADRAGTGTTYAQRNRLYLNDGSARFKEGGWPAVAEVSRALAVGDLDGDSVADLVVLRRAGQPLAWRGLADPRRALQVRVKGRAGNPDALGTELTLRDAAGVQHRRVRVAGGYQASGDPRPVFAFRGAGELEVRFPDGSRTTVPVTAPGALTLEVPAP